MKNQPEKGNWCYYNFKHKIAICKIAILTGMINSGFNNLYKICLCFKCSTCAHENEKFEWQESYQKSKFSKKKGQIKQQENKKK